MEWLFFKDGGGGAERISNRAWGGDKLNPAVELRHIQQA